MCVCVCVCACTCSVALLYLTLHNPMDCSMSGSSVFPGQESWGGLPFPSPGDLPNSGIKPVSPALQVDSLPLSCQESLEGWYVGALDTVSQISMVCAVFLIFLFRLFSLDNFYRSIFQIHEFFLVPSQICQIAYSVNSYILVFTFLGSRISI